MLVRIVSLYFVAGIEIKSRDPNRTAPIISYMQGWSNERIIDYCAKKGWTYEVTDMGDIEVVNRHAYLFKIDGTFGEYIGRGTPLGNKYNTGNRNKDIADFKKDLWEEMRRSDSEMSKELEKLYYIWKETGKLILVCSCKPKACHGDVIKAALEWIDAR